MYIESNSNIEEQRRTNQNVALEMGLLIIPFKSTSNKSDECLIIKNYKPFASSLIPRIYMYIVLLLLQNLIKHLIPTCVKTFSSL